jgi:hypothetical protein
MASWATLKQGNELWEIFPSGNVPIISIVPITPREAGCPLCYVVESSELTNEQLQKLAERIHQQWYPECDDIQDAIDYISNGCPLKTTHFSGVSTDDFYQVPWGAAMNIAMRMQEDLVDQ